MPRNPMYTTGRDSQNMGVQSPAPGAEVKKNYLQSNNDFSLTYKQGATLRYSDVHPFFVLEGLPADRIPLESFHNLRSYTLQAPLESEVYLHKSMTMVPMKAILPNTWDRFIVNPTKGDDVPDDVYCNFDPLKVLYMIQFKNNTNSNVNSKVRNLVRLAIMAESIFSKGSLLANLKIDLSSYFTSRAGISFDEWFDTVFYPWLKTSKIVVSRDLGSETQLLSFEPVQDMTIESTSPHTIFECLRDGCLFSLPLDITVPTGVFDVLTSFITNYCVNHGFPLFDISRPIAYQLSCVATMVDDSIDNIYTDSLFRSLMYEYFAPDFFDYNGNPVQYDAFSMHTLMSKANLSNTLDDISDTYYAVFALLFGFRRSLKFSDYFVDARPEPYSVGEMSAEVRDGMVSAIDTTVSILRQRFLNWSNRVGNKLFDYIKNLTGVSTSPQDDETKYIVHEVYPVTGFEVENTGADQRDQLTVTTLLKTQQSKYLYDIEIDNYCILLGLAHFDMERMYTGVVDRLALKTNRFDYFNKFFQYSGDQDIKRIELNSALVNPEDAMAYTTRHMQYKTSVNHVTGGFATGALPGWLNVCDYDSSALSTLQRYGINSEFIRNHAEDFDQFYSSLSAVSLGNYFHFIMKFESFVNASRQMAIAPDIL